MRQNRIVGMSAVVIQGNECVLRAGYGWADRSARTAVTPGDSVFPLGSITKLFTATAIMQLVEQGKVDLDAPMSRYIELPARTPGPPAPADPTIRQLLTHHGGLPGNYLEGFQLKLPDPAGFRRLPVLMSSNPSSFPPDTVFAYCNAGYGLLGCVVEAASGEAYTDFIARHILAPLGMTRTRFFTAAEDAARSAKGYDAGRERTAYPIRDLPAGSLMATASDMERFLRFVIDRGKDGVLGRTAFAEMLRRQNASVTLDGEFPIGLGYWLIKPFAVDDLFASHGGDMPPFHTILVTIPDRRTGLFLAANSSGAASTMIPLAVDMIRRVYSWQVGHPVEDAPLPARIRLKREELDALAGHYASPMGLIDVETRNGRLLTRLQGLPLELVPRDQGVFTPEVSILGIASIRVPQLAPVRFAFFESAGGFYLRITALGVLAGVGERFVPAQPPEVWKARAGGYHIVRQSENADYTWPRNVSLRIDRAHGLMLLYDFPGLSGCFPLSIPDEAHAVIRGKGTGLGETITARDGNGSTRLEWSGLVLEKD